MPSSRRWGIVLVGVLALLAVPFALDARPVPAGDRDPVELLQAIAASGDVAYVGLVRTRGGVQLPTDDALTGLATLVGRDGRLRAWWQSEGRWRVATLRTTGETDLLHRDGRTLRWVYESKNVTVFPDAPVRLPQTVDMLPPTLATRLLAGARPEELSTVAGARVAGRPAAGLRLTPSDPQASVAAVDVWADADTGLPLRVAVYDDLAAPAVLASEFDDLSLTDPDPASLSFRPPPDARVRFEETVDLAAAADRFAERFTPDVLAGLPRRATGWGSVGVYGRGPTLLLALPLRHEDAHDLRENIESRPGAACSPLGQAVTNGPIHLLVTDPHRSPWLLAGTVTPGTAETAARELAALAPPADPDAPPPARCAS